MTEVQYKQRSEVPSTVTVIVIIVAVIAGLFALTQLYENSKTDGFDSGWIKVSRCEEENADWKIYKCYGDYTSGVGMMGANNVSITVTTQEPAPGEHIQDVYPPMFHWKNDTNYFITGKERSSVLYNAPWLLLLGLAVFVPIILVIYRLSVRKVRNS